MVEPSKMWITKKFIIFFLHLQTLHGTKFQRTNKLAPLSKMINRQFDANSVE